MVTALVEAREGNGDQSEHKMMAKSLYGMVVRLDVGLEHVPGLAGIVREDVSRERRGAAKGGKEPAYNVINLFLIS